MDDTQAPANKPGAPADGTSGSVARRPPLPIYPGYMSAVDMATRDSIPFRWSPVEGAGAYVFRLYRAGGARPLFVLRTRAPGLVFTRLELLDEGEFYWQVDAEMPGSTDAPLRGTGRFMIMLSERPEQPRLQLD